MSVHCAREQAETLVQPAEDELTGTPRDFPVPLGAKRGGSAEGRWWWRRVTSQEVLHRSKFSAGELESCGLLILRAVSEKHHRNVTYFVSGF